MVSNPRFDFVYDLLYFYYTCPDPSKPCFDFVFDLLELSDIFLTIILYHSYVFPNPSKRRPGELRALVVPLEKVRCRLILKMCHVLLCQSLYQQFILHTVRIDFCVQIRDPREVVVGLHCVMIAALLHSVSKVEKTVFSCRIRHFLT